MFGEWEEPDDPNADLNEQEKLLKRINKLSAEKLKMDREIAIIQGDSMAQFEAELGIAKKLADLEEEMRNKASSYTVEEKAALQEKIDMQQQLVEGILLAGETAEEAVSRLKKATSGMAKEGSDAGKAFFGGIAAKMGLASKAGDNWISKLQVMGKKMKDPEFAKNFKKSFKEIFTLQNMVSSGMLMVAQATIALALAAEKSVAAFAKATGTGRKYQGMLADIAQNNRDIGIANQDANKAVEAAMNNYSDFGLMAQDAQYELATFAATMEKNGVALDTTLSSLDMFEKGLGMSKSAAQDYLVELNSMADSLGMTTGELTKLSKEGMKSLTAFGKGATKVFNDTMAMAKGLGVEMQDLLSFAEGFQTFEDSAKNVTSLNAVLGTSLSQMEMMAAEAEGGPAAAMEMMLRNFQKHGVEFKKLDIHTQRAVAHAMGIKDMTKAAKMFGGNLSGFKKYQKESAEAAKKQEDMRKKAEAAMDVQQNFMMAMQQMAAELKPVINALAELSRMVLKVATAFGDRGTVAIVGITLGLGALIMVLPSVVSLMTIFGTTAAPAATGGVASLGTAVTTASPGLFVFGQGMLMVGAGMLMAGLAILLVIGGFALLVFAISQLAISGGEAAVAMIGVAIATFILAKAFAVLAAVGAPGAAIVAGLAWAFTALALGVAMAGIGIATAFSEINTFIDKDGDLLKVAKSLTTLATAFSALNTAMSGGGLLSAGLNAVTGGVWGMLTGSGAPKKSPIQQMIEDLQPLIDNADTLATIFGGLEKVLNADIGKTMTDLGAGLENISNLVDGKTQKGLAISHTLENLALVTTGTSAQSTSGLGAVVKALSGFGERGMEMTIKLKKEDILSLMEEGVINIVAEATK